ncbi:MAG: phenylacetate-CoA oxygenase subunit PaaJ [Gammaproteobacteria bacterium]|nr:phenylacetate-CoA oxygenase subunit PaaJ [Gammaproteobacteria bacterium]
MTTTSVSEAQAWSVLNRVADPEIPVLSITDLGIVRWIKRDADELVVGLAPTYTGCPATEVIAANVLTALRRSGYDAVRVETVLSPPWTTDWISDEGREKLHRYGIVPPASGQSKKSLLGGSRDIACPRCDCTSTTRVSEYGSTPCKAAYKCDSCLEPFEYFKCI